MRVFRLDPKRPACSGVGGNSLHGHNVLSFDPGNTAFLGKSATALEFALTQSARQWKYPHGVVEVMKAALNEK